MNVKTVEFDLTRFGGIRALDALGTRRSATADVIMAASVPSVPRDKGIVYPIQVEEKDEGEGCKETTIESARDTRDSQGQPAAKKTSPTFRFVANGMDFGDICAGWTPEMWADELHRKARCCEEIRPDIADYYRRWANDIEARLRR